MKYRSIVNLLMGTGVAQVVVILFYPLLARLYVPHDFGVYGGVMAIVTVLTAIMTARADKLILFVHDDSRRDLLLGFGALASLIALIAIIAIPYVRSWMPEAGADLLVLGVVASALSALINILVGAHASALKTRRIVTAQFVRNLATILSQVLLFFVIAGPRGLMVGTIVGVLVSAWLLVRSGRLEGLLPSIRGMEMARIVKAVRTEVPQLFWGATQGLFGSFTNAAPMIFAVVLLTPALAGIYMIADRLVRVPVILVASTIRGYVAVHSRHEDGSPDLRFMFSISLVLGGLAMLGVVPVNLWGEAFFTLYLGDQWVGTGTLVAILYWFIVSSFVSLPWQAYLLSLGRSQELVVIELAYLASRVIPLALLGTSLDLLELGLVVVLSNLLYNLLYILYFARAYRKGELWSPRTPPESAATSPAGR